MKREQAVSAYRRTKALRERQAAKLRASILVPVFGSDMCRLHNCILNYESGYSEGAQHPEQYKLAKRYLYLEDKSYRYFARLSEAFARHF